MNPPSPPVAPATRDEWSLIIRPQRPWFDLRFVQLWHARDLIALFVRRDFVATYKQTILGPLWYLIQPILTTLTFSVIFGRVAGLSTDGLPLFVFYMSGTVIWNYFSSCLTKTSVTFRDNEALFGKVYFPRLTVPISLLISNLIMFAVQFGLLLGFVCYFSLTGAAVHPNATALLLPVLLLIMAGLGMGSGILVSALTTKYRDLAHLVTFGVQLLMYATPIIYPISAVPARYQALVRANPLTSVIEAFRYAFLGAGAVSITGLLYSAAFASMLLAAGLLLFNRIEQTFMDTV